jgi:hypothetical protein
LQVTGAGIGSPTYSASCATEHQRIAALEAANALLNATVFAQAAEISELRWRLLGMPAYKLWLLSRSPTRQSFMIAACTGARPPGALRHIGSAGTALAPAVASPLQAHGTPLSGLSSVCRVRRRGIA